MQFQRIFVKVLQQLFGNFRGNVHQIVFSFFSQKRKYDDYLRNDIRNNM